MKDSNSKKRKKLWLGIGIGCALALTSGTYVAAYFVAGNQVPARAEARGVAIGGLTPATAEQRLRDELGDGFGKPVMLRFGERSVELDPASSGLSVDFAQTVHNAGAGFSWNPAHIYRSLAGGESVDLVFDIDREKLKQAVAGVTAKFELAPVDATITLVDGKVSGSPAVVGHSLKVDETVDRVIESFTAGKQTVEPALATVEPETSDAKVAEFRDGTLKKALTGAVTLTTANGDLVLTEEQITTVVQITGKGSDLAVGVNEVALQEVTKEALSKLSADGPKNASYTFADGGVTVVPGKSGTTIGPEQVSTALKQALEGDRTAKIESAVQEPEFTTEKAEQLKPTQVIGEFTTHYPHSHYRNVNIGQAAKLINGTVVLPGETFSMNNTVGERTPENGFTEGYVINGGALQKSSGGGVSQAATTLFNAAFFAGYEDVEHKPHSLYFPRYPAGREATVYYGAVDLRFKNNTEYPAIIQGFIDPSGGGKKGSVTFRIWSRPTWDKVESSELRKFDYYSGGTRVSNDAKCEPQSPIQGFSVSYDRLFYKGGQVVKTEPFFWKYDAGDRITCA